MENANNWYFTKEQLANTPSRRSGIDITKELSYRQQAANFIQDMGQRLQVSQLCINTAIVYMHRFYVFHSFTDIHRNNLSVAALFLAAKVEEQPRKLEHVIKIAHACLHKDAPPLDVRSEAYAEKHFEVVTNESILLQTLGFVLAIEHPHTWVVKLCQMVKACKDLAQTSYFMATTSLHMTTMCVQYKPTVVAAVCIHLACKWSSWKIEPCSEGKEWYYYVDKTVSLETIEALTQDFVTILESSPHRFKRKFIPQKPETSSHASRNVLEDSSKHHPTDNKSFVMKKEVSSPGPSTSSSSFSLSSQVVEKMPKVSVKVESGEKRHLPSQSHSPLEVCKKMKLSSHSISIDAYREKKERERLEQKSAPAAPVEPNVQQIITNKPQLALNDHEKISKYILNSLESIPHSPKDKANKNVITQESQHQVHPASISKVNHHFPKKSDSLHSKDIKSNLLKISSNVSSDPVVILERVDVKSEVLDSSVSEKSQTSPCKVKNVQENFSVATDNVPDSKNPVSGLITMSPLTVSKSKHHKHKANSTRSNHNSIHPHSQKPDKDIKTNGSKETELNEKEKFVIENSVINVKIPDKHETSKHEKRDKYKSKHSSSSSKDKTINSESSLNPIKVKIRKEVINKLPEKSPKMQSSSREESPKTSLKIKLPKPPIATAPEPSPLKIVLTKDKSGSGTYCTSRKNDRESRKRAHSPSSRHEANYKSSGDTPSKHIKLDHAHSSHSSAKQNKVRHSSSRHTDHISNSVSSNKLLNLGNESIDYHNVGVESYVDPAFSGNQYFIQMSPPPQPPPLPPLPPPDSPTPGYKIKTNYNHLSTQLPRPPPPE